LPASDPYKLEEARVQKFGDQRALVQVYASSEGRFSLFQVRSIVDPSKLRRAKGEYKIFSWQKNGASFVIVGDLPEDKLKQIAQRLGA